jgi:enoyl-CoA hydratase
VRVTTERRGTVLLVTMVRAEKRNAIDAEMTAALDAAFTELEGDPSLAAGVLAGGAAVFSAGTDLRATAGAPTERGGEYGLIRRKRRKPLVAAVEGAALGGGFELVLACDVVVASHAASFGLPEVKRGVIATCGGVFRSGRVLPLNIARELLLTGESLDARRAHTLGLVNELTEPGEAVARALAMAERIAANAPVSLRETLTALEEAYAEAERAGWAATERSTVRVTGSDDFREGVAAFTERRPPRWTGR